MRLLHRRGNFSKLFVQKLKEAKKMKKKEENQMQDASPMNFSEKDFLWEVK